MILHDAVVKLREAGEDMGTEDGDLMYQYLPDNHVCQFSRGKCMGCEFGGRISEVSTPEPFSACMRLENIYGAPLKSPKTRAAALGALSAAAGFLMLNRKTGPCNSVYFEDCRAELIEFCSGKAVYIIGEDIAGIAQTLMPEEAELVLVNGEAFFDDSLVEEIEEVLALGKEVMLIGQNCHGLSALMHLPIWCPYGV
ncbi:MAG TPA: hypothetical protein O0X62_01580 [Methanocorpusculum sp.]|nr:hypothetical protein [Methanocorpusculum parvum]HJJ78437.1 hypothetical protein [Methanocorpusculum sp.]